MSDDVEQFPSAQRRLVGETVKVCRHGECLWLKVKSVRPSGELVALLDNDPVEWPQKCGEPVEIKSDEIVAIYG